MLPIKYYVVLDEFDTLEDARRMLYSMVDYTPRQCSVLSSTRCIFVPKDNAHSTLESKSDKPPEDFNGPIKSGYIKIENNQFISLIKGLTCTSPFSIESD